MTDRRASDARAEILGSIRRSLGVTGRENTRRAAVFARLAEAPRGVVPARGQLDGRGRIDLFRDLAEGAQASVREVATAADVPAEVARFLRDSNLPARACRGDDPRLEAMPWKDTALEMRSGPSAGHDLTAVSHAFAGVAETGTLVLVSGADNPTTLNFLPDNHVVVVDANDVAADFETVWDRLRSRFGRSAMPRTVNCVTGPSRSADIEQKLQLGAHGPRRLHIVVVNAT